MRLDPLTPGQVIDHWDQLQGFALQMERRYPDDWPVHYFLAQIDSGEMQAWIAHEDGLTYALVGTSLVIKPSGRRFMWIRYASGKEQNRWRRVLVERIEELAREKNCDVLDASGRDGWVPGLPDFKVISGRLLRKELR
jgi:hypothetical protein